MKNRKRLLGLICLILGISLISFYFLEEHFNYLEQERNRIAWEKQLEEMQNLQPGPDDIPEVPDDIPLNSGDILGVIKIEKIGVDMIIRESTTEDILLHAVGHFENTALPGRKGNFALAGHRGTSPDRYLYRLDELVVGDEILIVTEEKTYTYIVIESFVVTPQQVEVLDQISGHWITIVTCTPIGTFENRLIIRGILIE